jgi:hypothetical protein
MTVAAGPGPAHGEAKGALRRGEPGAALALWTGAHEVAAEAGLAENLGQAAETLGFRLAE